ncbi:hypothetical protein A2814_02560 [Candidatus Nomurabacteria bacterium RIFCSPHIGHO2_01_FULL_38_19]|uniref:GIY-YIG domain-containing protein n=1 Tax=Candidatus Nomurabacteria bacterium RIFCSPHIGHO2_01_FULL_38_19 TaxID=1801732 RepID=A0A1F6URG2_9BACT|nr:MAG: hypothetical protein A2814_02560 [Candidatus Nomurabacteria bacterium RIFCSPHIGHO2_01_FULL_38_19]
MFYIYILFSEKDNRLYTGYSPNLKERIKKHNSGYVIATRNRRPVKLICYEAYLTELDAKRREKYLKGGKGKAELKIQLKECFKKVNYENR